MPNINVIPNIIWVPNILEVLTWASEPYLEHRISLYFESKLSEIRINIFQPPLIQSTSAGCRRILNLLAQHHTISFFDFDKTEGEISILRPRVAEHYAAGKNATLSQSLRLLRFWKSFKRWLSFLLQLDWLLLLQLIVVHAGRLMSLVNVYHKLAK